MTKLPSGCSTEIIRQLFEKRAAHNAADYVRAERTNERMNERTNERTNEKIVALFFTYLAAKFYDVEISTDGGTHLCSFMQPLSALESKWMEVENPKILKDSSVLPFSRPVSLPG